MIPLETSHQRATRTATYDELLALACEGIHSTFCGERDHSEGMHNEVADAVILALYDAGVLGVAGEQPVEVHGSKFWRNED